MNFKMHTKFCVIILLLELRLAISYYHVKLTSDSPTVVGGTVHFTAELFDDGEPASGKFKYIWMDNSILNYSETHESESNVDTWSVTYAANASFPPGPYEVQVSVEKFYVIFYLHKTSQRLHFEITEHLNGRLELVQNNEVVTGKYVSSTSPVVHKVILTKSDEDYVNRTSTSVLTYWFVDCVYYGVSADYSFTLKYPDVDKKHKLEALVVVGYDPITTPAPPTTTPLPNITTAVPATTTLPPNTTTAANTNVTAVKVKRSVTSTDVLVPSANITPQINNSFPFVCMSNGTVAPNKNKTYGLFSRNFVSKAPVSNITVTGNYWLTKGEILSLKVKCQGSSQFYYCKHIYEGAYNVTGNETCDVPPPDTSDHCEFPIQRYLQKADKYTIAIVIYNDVAKIVSPVTVTIYEVAHQAQLSVIVVPVASSLVAIVLIIFGVAYYVQNRSRFIVEVADFNFGQQCSDLEYKTFRERLYDSIANAFFRAPSPSSSEPTVWPPGRKYGSLT